MKTLQQRFGQVVREYRTELGISQEELADLAGLHRTYVSLLERGLRNPSLEVMFRLGKSLETPVSKLVSRIE